MKRAGNRRLDDGRPRLTRASTGEFRRCQRARQPVLQGALDRHRVRAARSIPANVSMESESTPLYRLADIRPGRCWPKCEVPTGPGNVCCLGQTRHIADITKPTRLTPNGHIAVRQARLGGRLCAVCQKRMPTATPAAIATLARGSAERWKPSSRQRSSGGSGSSETSSSAQADRRSQW